MQLNWFETSLNYANEVQNILKFCIFIRIIYSKVRNPCHKYNPHYII